MTQDRKDDSRGSREIEKSRKKTTDSSASVSKEKTSSSADGLPTKVRLHFAGVMLKYAGEYCEAGDASCSDDAGIT